MGNKGALRWVYVAIFLAVWLVFMTLMLDLSPFGRSKNAWETNTHNRYGFSFEYPTKWRVQKYGELGFKGDENIKVIIHQSWISDFNIKIRLIPMPNPTLDDAMAWGEQRIQQMHQSVEEVNLWEEEIDGQPVARRQYKRDGLLEEEVYFVRSQDIVVITLQSSETSFNVYAEDFERIVESFSSSK